VIVYKSQPLSRLAFFLFESGVQYMLLVINGESREVSDVATVTDMLVSFKLEQKILVVELNREIVERAEYDTTSLQEGDRLEIVHFVGGG
jgi:sulfur carrier protein